MRGDMMRLAAPASISLYFIIAAISLASWRLNTIEEAAHALIDSIDISALLPYGA